MKKILTLILGLLLIGATAQAQSGLMSFGVKGGVGATSFDLSGDNTQDWKSEGTASWHIGGMFRTNIPVLPIYAQIEALYTRVGGSISYNGISQDTYTNRFDVPIVAGFKFGLLGISARVFGGAVAQANISDNYNDAIKQLNPTSNESISTEDFVWGWQAGIGADIKKLTVDVKYEAGSDLITQQTGAPSMKNSQWMLSVGYFFGE